MSKRTIAIEWTKENAKDNIAKLLDSFCGKDGFCTVKLFTLDSLPQFKNDEIKGKYETIMFPKEIDSIPKRKNFILDHAKSKGFNGFLHIVEDTIVLDRDPAQYIEKIEKTMDVLDYNVHFSTVTDSCNYVFKKFNPRLTLDIDDENAKTRLGLPDRISFTSHSNICWTIFDFNKLGDDIPKFDEKFTIAMYVIIEYLARRRAQKKEGQLYFMNQYLSISDEIGSFHQISLDGDSIDQYKMKEEDGIFKQMKVEFAPDNNIDMVLDMFYQKVKEKLA